VKRAPAAILALLVLASLVAGCASGGEPVNSSSPTLSEYERRAEPEPILGVTLPARLPSLIAVMGEPDRIDLPPADEPSPAGQWFRWNPGPKYNTVIALAGDYSATKPNLRAGIGLLAVRANKRGIVTTTIHGFELNRTTRQEVEQSLVGLAPSNISDWLGEGNYIRSALQFMKRDIYTYFLFGAEDRLVGVAQASFYVDGAD